MALEVYAGLLLHKAGKEINESNLKKVLEASGAHVDEAKLKALVASLHGVNIDDAIKQAAVAPVAAHAAPAGGEKKAAEKKPEEEKKSTEEAAAGLSALFS
ncbi:50S ribosomal protein P1 [Candidatus Woesearchaeota archaeon]|nr:50S ribosomal protein P1 [Candidatus Woesearchaeota archaeon]